jgi:predicted PurR-regulated permease PerM
MDNKKLALVAIAVVLIQFLYIERDILIPFILAAIFAYIFNAIVDTASKYLKLPRIISVFIIYIVLLGIVALVAFVLGNRLLSEIREITKNSSIDDTAQSIINSLPSISIAGQNFSLQDYANHLLDSLKNGSLNIQAQAQPFFTGAVRQGVNLIVFFVASIYILRDWKRMHEYIIKLFPASSREEASAIWAKISKILGAYLRGQLILVAIMTAATFICLEILGVRYALILALLSGFLEIIPYVGPVIAAATAAGVSFLNGQNHFSLDPATLAIIVVAIYIVLRHIEDYLVIPLLYQRLTRLHPLVVIFAVLSAGHIFGLLGLIIAVPIAASAKVLLEYLADRPISVTSIKATPPNS